MNKTTILLLLCTLVTSAFSQRLHTISLQEFSYNPEQIPFAVDKIIDARRDRSLGIIQLGLNNRPDIATFEAKGLQEIEQLLERSGLLSPKGLSIRISALKVSEITKFAKETAKAEINIDFFLRHEDQYYYIYSSYTTIEQKGIDVTDKHAENIVKVFEKAFNLFVEFDKDVNADEAFTLEQLMDPHNSFRNPLDMPIINDSTYQEGYYTSFEEFVNNSPSIDMECKIKIGNEIQVKFDDGTENTTDLYGFSSNNELYILYHHKFYKLEKKKDAFYFYGPTKLSKNSGRNIAEVYWGIGPNYISLNGNYSARYKIDLATGSIQNISAF